MKKQNKKSFLMTATEAQLMTMSMENILEEVAQRFNDLREEAQKSEVSSKTALQLDQRTAHTCILYAEGKRLSHSHPDLAKPLMAASIYWQNTQAMDALTDAERKALLKRIEEIEEAKREEERKRRLRKK